MNAWGTHGRSHGGMPGWKLRETHGRCMETQGGAHGVHIGRHQRNAQDYTEEREDSWGNAWGTHGWSHGPMPGWTLGGEHMDGAWRNTAGWKLGGSHGWCMGTHSRAHSWTHWRTPEERAEAHRRDARKDTRKDERWDAQKDARWHARMENWGTHGRCMQTHGGGTQLDTREDTRRTRRSTQMARTEGHTEGRTEGRMAEHMEGRTAACPGWKLGEDTWTAH